MRTPLLQPWPGKTTARERFNRQMHFQPFDRSFHWEFGYWLECFRDWPMFRDNGVQNNQEAETFLGFDRLALWETNLWMSPPFLRSVVRETGSTRIIQNVDGLLAEVPSDGHATVPHFLKSSVEKPDDWRRVKEERFRRGGPSRAVDLSALRAAHPPTRAYPLGVYCGSLIGKIRNMLTFEGLAYACADYPDMVEDMVEKCCVLAEDCLDQVLGAVDFDFAWGWEDICFKNGPMVSLDFFRRVLAPRYQRIGRKLAKFGIDVWFTDCDGDLRLLVPELLACGINCLFPHEVNASGHPADLLERYPGQLRIMGGFDKMALGEGREAIRSYMSSIAPWVERGGFIPFCDHRCPPNVRPDDYLYYLELKEQTFGVGR
jgi:hypothetical protein